MPRRIRYLVIVPMLIACLAACGVLPGENDPRDIDDLGQITASVGGVDTKDTYNITTTGIIIGCVGDGVLMDIDRTVQPDISNADCSGAGTASLVDPGDVVTIRGTASELIYKLIADPE